jgi:hypothetical protein
MRALDTNNAEAFNIFQVFFASYLCLIHNGKIVETSSTSYQAWKVNLERDTELLCDGIPSDELSRESVYSSSASFMESE